MNTPDLDRIRDYCQRFPEPSLRDDVMGWMAVYLLEGMSDADAYRAAAAPFHTYLRHKRGEVSLDALVEALGDSVTVQPMAMPDLTDRQAEYTFGARGKRELKAGIDEWEEEDINFLLTVIRNLTDRGVISVGNPFTFALDVRRLNTDLRRAVIARLCLFARHEQRSAGLPVVAGERWLRKNAAYRYDQA